MKRERQILKRVFVNDKENEQIKTRMKNNNKENFSDYARELLLNGEIKLIDFKIIKELRYEVHKIGININQVVKLANEKREVDKNDLEQIIKNQKELSIIISKIINKEIKKEKK